MAKPLADVLAYRTKLRDAVTNEDITPATRLVALHQPRPGSVNGDLITRLTGIAYPAKPCSIIAKGACFPPRDFDGAPPYELFITCNRLLTAPTLRLECVWTWHNRKRLVAIEFAFCDGQRSLSRLAFHRDVERGGTIADEVRFQANGATCEGFNVARNLGAELGIAGQQVLSELQRYLSGTKDMRLRLGSPLEDDRYALASILPYITEMPLTSLSAPQWAALVPLRADRDIEDLINHPTAPFPMVPLKGYDTFTSTTHAAVEYYESTRIAWLEQEVALTEWASVLHKAVLLKVGASIALAVQFKQTRPLGGPASTIKFDLPDRFLAKANFKLQGYDECVPCERSPVPVDISWPHDAIFVLHTNKRAIRQAAVDDALQTRRHTVLDVEFKPTMPERQLRVKLATAVNLLHPDSEPWQRIILNQDHQSLPTIDLATGKVIKANQSAPRVPQELDRVVEQAFQWMLRWRNWNQEQLDALVSVREAVGGIVLVSGPAGTGKTLLIQAICVFFYLIGLHVLVLAPANSNLNDFMGKLKELFGESSAIPVKATRVYPTSADFSPAKIAKGQKCVNTPESSLESASESHIDQDAVGDVLEFEMVRSDLHYSDDKYTTHRDYGLPAQVFRAARDGSFELHHKLPGDEKASDVWKALAACMATAAAGAFDWHDKVQVERYQKAYDLCKAHYLAQVRMICTTTGNVRSSDIVDNWAANKHDTETTGIVVVLDEACKDNEIDSVSALLNPEWRNKIFGMVMLGDENQLEPTNTGAKGKMVFNPFNDRIGISLMSRLSREGFPAIQLLEQRRMNHHIAEWPFKAFYPTGMRNGPGTFLTLRQKLPGLFECLTGILSDLGTVFQDPLMTEDQRDRVLRTHYLEIKGHRDNSRRSAVVLEHVKFFCDKIYWDLRAYFREKTYEKVMVICAYKQAKKSYEEALRYLQRQYRIPDAQLPRIATIDSSQGAEAPVTIIDCSVQQYDPRTRLHDIGFVDDDKRMNVAMTRAQEVRWFLGGNCNIEKRLLRQPNTPAYVRYRESVSEFSGEMTPLGEPKGGRLTKGWLEGLSKHHASATRTYTADVARLSMRQ